MPGQFLARRKGRTRPAFVVFIFLGLTLFAVFVLPPKSRATRQAPPFPATSRKRGRPETVPGQILVRYRSESVAKRLQRAVAVTNKEGRAVPISVERFEGSELVEGLRLARVAPEDTASAIEALKAQPEVLYAEPDYVLHADTTTPNDPSFGQLYGMTKIGAPTAWDTAKGSTSVVVGIVDEGIDISHPDLQANIWNNPSPGSISGISGDLHGYDFVNNSGTIPPGDHATHVSGIVGAVGNNGVGVVGVNWQVGLMSLRFLGPTSGSDSDAIRAYNYARQMHDLWVSSGGSAGANVRVLNNSYGGGGFQQASLDAIKALNQSGILFVASEGNDAVDSDVNPHYPSGYDAPNVISVSATNSADSLASFSNFGAQTATLGAPGVSILSTTTNNTYQSFSGTSMATPHVTGSAALLCSKNPNLTVPQLKSLLMFNGDVLPSLAGLTLTGRRLNVANSLQALGENDTTPPGTVSGFQVTSQSGRSVSLAWTASGDDAAVGQASLYQLSFVDADTGAVVPLRSIVPPASGSAQTLNLTLPYRHRAGTVKLREFDNVGNEGTPTTANVSVGFADGDPYATTLGSPATLSTGGTPLGLTFDDRYKENYALPFPFPFFGQNYNSVTISTNGNLYFSTPPKRTNGDADDVPSSTVELSKFKMIAGLWDDLYLGTDQRADADVYFVQPDADRIIFRWQGVPCSPDDITGACTFVGSPVNFEIELGRDGTIKTRYGSGNTNLFPVVGISGGEPDPYTIPTHTSEQVQESLTNAQSVTFLARTAINPLDNANFFVSQHYRDFLSREPDPTGLDYWSGQITGCPNQTCINSKRLDVSNAFFYELEFQQTGAYVYRLYRLAYGNNQPFPNPDNSNLIEAKKLPSYAVFASDRAQVIGGANLPQAQLNLANAFVGRAEFLAKYPASLTTGDQFVDALLLTIQTDIGVNLTAERTNLINLFISGGRGAVVYRLADDNVQTNPINNRAFIDAEYNRSFVATQYFGYLRRNADIGGFLFWLGQVSGAPLRDVPKQHAMVCSFVAADEYQLRFSTIISHHQQGECP